MVIIRFLDHEARYTAETGRDKGRWKVIPKNPAILEILEFSTKYELDTMTYIADWENFVAESIAERYPGTEIVRLNEVESEEGVIY